MSEKLKPTVFETLCQYVGGSHLYKLNGPNSDIDKRGVFMHDDPLWRYGFYSSENQTNVTTDDDVCLHELRQFLQLCTNSNTQTLECLFAPLEAFNVLDEDFHDLVLVNRLKLINSERLYKSLRGYLQNELRLATGERTGKLGGKRKNTIDEWGFSPKNFSHLFRLATCGKVFFETGEFPVSLKEVDPVAHGLCLDVKMNPQRHTMEDLVARVAVYEKRFEDTYAKTKVYYHPDFHLVRKILKHFNERNIHLVATA